MKVLKENRSILIAMLFLFLVVTCYMLTSDIVAHAEGNSTKGNVDYSFLSLSKAATQYVNQACSFKGNGAIEMNKVITGNAGGAIGVMSADTLDKGYMLCSLDSSNTTVWSYSSLLDDLHTEAGNNGTCKGAYTYALYGYALGAIGLDEVTTGADNTRMRMIVGIGFIVLYVMSVGISSFFNICMATLYNISPFRLFEAVDNWRVSIGKPGSDAGNAMYNAFDKISKVLSGIYDTISDLSLFILIPITIAVTLFMWLVIYQGQNFVKLFKPIFIRVLFLVAGVPLLFSLYDAVLKCAYGSVKADEIPATKAIASTFCDFGAWVDHNNLGLPSGQTIKVQSDFAKAGSPNSAVFSVSPMSLASARQFCYSINTMNYDDLANDGKFDIFNVGDPIGSSAAYTKAVLGADESGALSNYTPKYTLNNGKMGQIESVNSASYVKNFESVSTVLNILQNYANGSKISSANYESKVKADMFDSSDVSSVKGAIVLFDTSSNWNNFNAETAGPYEYNSNSGGAAVQMGNTGLYRNDLDIKLVEDDGKKIAEQRWKSKTINVGNGVTINNIFADGTADVDGGFAGGEATGVMEFTGNGDKKYLSTLSMYNYLNTKFTASEVRVSSPTETSNDQVKYQHYKVTMVGYGFMKFIYILNIFALFGCCIVVSYGYAGSLLIANFKAMISLVPNVISGALGSMKGIASSIALVFAMCAELVGTVCLFDLAMYVISAIYGAIELPLSIAFKSFNTATGNLPLIIMGLIGLTSSVAMFTIMKKLLVLRTAVVMGMTDACTTLVKKFTGAESVSNPNLESGTMGGLATAVGTAATVAYAAEKGGLIDPDAKESLTGALTGRDGHGGLANLSGSFIDNLGVKSGNGTGATVNGSKKGKGLNYGINQGASSDEASKEFYDNNKDDFESKLGGGAQTDAHASDYLIDNEQGAQLAGADKTYRPDGTSTMKFKDENGNEMSRTISKSTDADGTVRVDDTLKDGDGNTKSLSSYVDSDTSTTSSNTVIDEDGNTNVSEETLNKRDGSKKLLNVSYDKSGSEISRVETTQTTDADGNVKSVSVSDINGEHIESEETVNASTGDKTVHKMVMGNGGVTTVDEKHHTLSNGNVVVKSVSSDGSTGVTTKGTATYAPGGNLVKSDEVQYDSNNNEIGHNITRVVTSNNAVQTKITQVRGNTSTTETSTVSGDGMSKVVNTKVSTGGHVRSNTTRSYTYNNTINDWEQVNITQDNTVNTTTHTNISGQTTYNRKETGSSNFTMNKSEFKMPTYTPSASSSSAGSSSGSSNYATKGGRAVTTQGRYTK